MTSHIVAEDPLQRVRAIFDDDSDELEFYNTNKDTTMSHQVDADDSPEDEIERMPDSGNQALDSHQSSVIERVPMSPDPMLE